MIRSDRVRHELETVAAKHPGSSPVDEVDGSLTLVIPCYPIPAATFDRDVVRIAVKVGPLYPAEKLDLFWVDPALRRRDGTRLPNVMSSAVALAGQQWTQISWHDNAPHDPRRVTILGFVHGIGGWFTGQKGRG